LTAGSLSAKYIDALRGGDRSLTKKLRQKRHLASATSSMTRRQLAAQANPPKPILTVDPWQGGE
jgi:hypothetical protein